MVRAVLKGVFLGKFAVAAVVAVLAQGARAALPAGYRAVDYIESDGNEYIDTGYVPKSTTRVVATFSIPSVDVGAVWSGCSSDGNAFGWCVNPSKSAITVGMNKWVTTAKSWVPDTEVHTIEFASGVQKLDNVAFDTQLTVSSLPAVSMYLFAFHESGVKYAGRLRLYSCQIYEGEDLVRDYVPCAIGDQGALFDQKAGSLATKGGSGTFAVPKGVPEGFEELIAIESTGSQWIDALVVPTISTRVVTKFAVASDATGGGYSGSYASDKTVFGWGYSVANNQISVALNKAWPAASVAWTKDGNVHTLDFASGLQKLDGVSFGSVEVSSVPGRSYALFAMNQSNGIQLYQKIKLFSCQIYAGDTLVRDFVPYGTKDGVCGLYDRVSEAMFLNSGTGSFTAWRKMKRAYYVESDGTQVFKTGVYPTASTRVVFDFKLAGVPTSSAVLSGREDNAATSIMAWGVSVNKTTLVASWCSWVGDSWSDILTLPEPAVDFNRHVFDIQSGSQKFDGREYATKTFTPTAVAPIYLFANCSYNAKTKIIEAKYHQKIKLFGCKVYEGDTLIRDYVPALDDEGHYGLQDMVSGVFARESEGHAFTGRESALGLIIVVE